MLFPLPCELVVQFPARASTQVLLCIVHDISGKYVTIKHVQAVAEELIRRMVF